MSNIKKNMFQDKQSSQTENKTKQSSLRRKEISSSSKQLSMETKTRRLSLVTCMAIGLSVFSGCKDNDYDLSSIDMTVGIGNGEFALPVCSTDTIQLNDVLKLNDSETVIEKANGDYFFVKDGDEVAPASAKVDEVVVIKKESKLYDFNFSLEQYLNQPGKKTTALSIPVNIDESQVVYSFSYEGDIPNEIEELTTTDLNGSMSVSADFSAAIKAFIPVISEIRLELPSFITIDNLKSEHECKLDGSKIVINNVNTANPIKLSFNLSKINVTAKDESLGEVSTANGKLTIAAKMKMGLKVSNIVVDATTTDPTKCKITSTMSVDDNITITNVEGRFNPSISLDNLGSADITGIPDFLSEDGVVLDVDNPQIMLTAESDLDIPGFVSGTLTAIKDGKTTTTINIPEMNIVANGTSRICICRHADKVDKTAFTSVVEIPNLSTLLTPIPDRITFSGNARADKNTVADFKLGKTYTLKPSYRIETPLAFAENAKIIYTDSFDDFNDDIKDLDVTENTHIEMTAEVENKVPAYLNATATAIDINGREMPESEVKVKVEGEIAASADGKTAKVSPLKVVLTPAKGALKKLDGIKFTVSGAAKAEGDGPAITGQTLNARKHSLVVKNIKIKFVGKAIADLN